MAVHAVMMTDASNVRTVAASQPGAEVGVDDRDSDKSLTPDMD